MASASKEVLNWVVEYIRDNDLNMGDLLPGEIEIAEKLSVGRSSVREAFAALKAFGLARSQQGVGLILTSDRRRLEMMSLFTHDDFDNSDYLAARQLRDFLELGAARSIMANACEKDIHELEKLVNQVECGAMSPFDFEVHFHECVASMSGNKFMEALGMVYGPLFKRHLEQIPQNERDVMPKFILDSHRRVPAAIRNKDIEDLIAAFEWQLDHTQKDRML